MATKRATVYVLAVGSDMGSDLPAAQSTLFSLLIAKVREQKAKDEVAVFLVGSGDTRYRNMLTDQGYQGVYQLWPPENTGNPNDTVHMANTSADLLRKVHSGGWNSAAQSDIVGGIVWGIDAMIQHCRHLKYEKLIRVMTNPSTMIDVGLMDGVINEAVAHGIMIDVVGAGFVDPTDDGDNGSSSNIPAAQPHLYSLTQRTGGRFFPDAVADTAAQTAIALHQPSSRPYGPTFLTLGDRDREDSLIRFPVQYVVKVKSVDMPKATKLSLPALEVDESDDWGDLVDGANATKPSSVTTPLPLLDTVKVELGTGYRIADDLGNADPNFPQVFESDALVTAYHYGKALIPLGDWEKDQVSNEATVGLMVIAFVPASSIRRDMFMSSTRYVVPNLKYEQADIRMAALVSIMRTRGLAAIARYVYNGRSSAKLVGLFAHTPKSGAAGLLMTELPTSFDCRRVSYMSLLTDEFANLLLPDGVSSGSGMINPRLPARFTPTLEQRQAMAVFVGNSLLVDSDDEDDESGENELDVEKHESSNPKYDRDLARKGRELLEPGSVCHPSLQRIHAAIEEALFGAQYPTILPSLSNASTGSASQATGSGSPSAPLEGTDTGAPSIPTIPGMQPPPEVWKRPGFDQALALLHRTHKTIKVEKKAGKRKSANEPYNLDGTAIGSIARAAGNALLMPQSHAMAGDMDGNGDGSQAKRLRLNAPHSQPLLTKTRWRQDFEKAVGAQDVDNVQQAMSELAAIANKFLEEGHVDEAQQCVAVMKSSVDTLNAEEEWRGIVEVYKSKGSALASMLT